MVSVETTTVSETQLSLFSPKDLRRGLCHKLSAQSKSHLANIGPAFGIRFSLIVALDTPPNKLLDYRVVSRWPCRSHDDPVSVSIYHFQRRAAVERLGFGDHVNQLVVDLGFARRAQVRGGDTTLPY